MILLVVLYFKKLFIFIMKIIKFLMRVEQINAHPNNLFIALDDFPMQFMNAQEPSTYSLYTNKYQQVGMPVRQTIRFY